MGEKLEETSGEGRPYAERTTGAYSREFSSAMTMAPKLKEGKARGKAGTPAGRPPRAMTGWSGAAAAETGTTGAGGAGAAAAETGKIGGPAVGAAAPAISLR